MDQGVVHRLDSRLDPFEALQRFADLPSLVLLHSAAANHSLSRYTYLSADPVALLTVSATDWNATVTQLRETIGSRPVSAGGPPFQGGWIGWLAYELGAAFDRISAGVEQSTRIPDASLGLYDWVIAWDHQTESCVLISTGVDALGEFDRERAVVRAAQVLARWNAQNAGLESVQQHSSPPVVKSNFTADEYRHAVQHAVRFVLDGDIFQVNIAQRFTAPFADDPVHLYSRIVERSPAPMGAFVQHGTVTVASASPERFIRYDARSRAVETRPIKGTRPRGHNAIEDAALREELVASEKDRAENVMIVDLMRNDLSKVSSPGSVRVPALCVVETHPTVHHLVSTVTSSLAPDHDVLDLLAATFPGGSITGAPKLRAMEIIQELEPCARGIYSGSIVWIGLDGSMDSSIAIRTATLMNGEVYFHGGGGITARSDPADEYQETLDKVRFLTDAVEMSG